jgi:hypothetical protein
MERDYQQMEVWTNFEITGRKKARLAQRAEGFGAGGVSRLGNGERSGAG